jgi:hypothetical protein
MVESGRKHGPFDFRYPVRRKLATPVWELQPDRNGPGKLEWSAFMERFFPNRRRHDSEALAGYEAYRNALDRAASPQSSPTGRPASAGGIRVRPRHAGRAQASSMATLAPNLRRAPTSVTS